MMNIFLSMLLVIGTVKTIGVVTYDVGCPHRSQWQQRANKYQCEDETEYHCLYDNNTKNLTEKCIKPDDIPTGLRPVLSGNLDLEKCPDNQFSPYMYWSNDSVQCPYQKSICSDEGQVLFDNGSDSKDIKCVCDYRRGYQYIFQPKDKCSCSPMIEDCSCILKRCMDNSFILTSEFICEKRDQVVPYKKCEITDKSRSIENKDHAIEADEGSFPDTYSNKITSVIVLGLFLAAVSVFFTLWFISMRKKTGIDENEMLWKNVKTLSQFPDLRNKLDKKSILVLKGRPGTGKNAIANSLKRFNRFKTCKIIRIKNNDLSELKSFNNKKETKLILIAEHIPTELKSLLQPHNPTDIICDLDDDNFYDTNDKKNILTFHRKKNNIPSEDEWNQRQTEQTSTEVYLKKSVEAALFEEKTLKGFPWMCASLCKGNINLGIWYFRQPPVDLVSDLDALKMNGEQDEMCAIKYSMLVTVLLHTDDELTVNNKYLKSVKEVIKEIYPKIKTDFTMETVNENLPKLMPRYLKNNNNSKIEFSHNLIYRAVLISFGKNHAPTVIKKCNISDILFILRPSKYHPEDDEMVLMGNYSYENFVKRVTDSLMGNASFITSIIEPLILYTETFGETVFLHSIIQEIQTNQSYTYQSRINFFRHFDVFAHDFSESFDPKLTSFCLAWDYVICKLVANERNSNVLKYMTDKLDLLKDFLSTCIDKYGNTLFHYLVLWNGPVEKNILFGKLSTYTTGVINEQQVNDFIVSTECPNNESRTPLHFAAYFGRVDFFDQLKKLQGIKRKNETVYKKLRNFWYQDDSTLDSLKESGSTYVSGRIQNDEYEYIFFEETLIPSSLDIKFGTQEDFDHIMFQ